MAAEAIVAWLHFLSAMALGATLCVQRLLLAGTAAPANAFAASRFAWIDLAYLAAALAAAATGFARLAWFGRGAAFYLHNPVFWIKLALFIAIGLVSATPTRYFLRWRREAAAGRLPAGEQLAHVRRFVDVELWLLILLPLAAAFAARGVGTAP